MADELTNYLKGKKPKGFVSRPICSADGDFLSIHLRDEDAYSERVDELLTVYLSVENDSLVGCKIKGVRRLLKTLGDFGVGVRDEDVGLNLLFLAGAAISSPRKRARYREMGRRAGNLRIPRKTLKPVLA